MKRIVVDDVCQSASGGSYVVKFQAEVKLCHLNHDIQVRVASTVPVNASLDLLEVAIDSIYEGFSVSLTPRNLGAQVIISNLVIHDIDFKPNRFKKSTVDALERFFSHE